MHDSQEVSRALLDECTKCDQRMKADKSVTGPTVASEVIRRKLNPFIRATFVVDRASGC